MLQTCHSLQLYSHHLKAFRNSILGQPTSHLMHKYSNDIVLYCKRKFPVRIYITIFKELITILTGSFLSQYNIIWIFMHEMISWWSIYTTWLSDNIKVAQNRYFWAFATKKEVRLWNVLEPIHRSYLRRTLPFAENYLTPILIFLQLKYCAREASSENI